MKTARTGPNFPIDLLIASMIPVVLIALATSWLLTLRGWPWIAAYVLAIAFAVSGAGLLLRAKLPLFREGRFFTFGSRHLPPSSHSLYRWGWRLSFFGIVLATLLLIGPYI